MSNDNLYPELCGIPDDALRAELKNRDEQRRLERLKKAKEHSALVTYTLKGANGLWFINVIAPEHDRTTCSDDRRTEHYGDRPDCTRCYLLQIRSVAYAEFEETMKLSAHIERRHDV